MTKLWPWLKRWSWLIASAFLVIAGFIFGGVFFKTLRKPSVLLKRELGAMKAGAAASAHAIKTNAATALALIEEAEKETIETLDESRRAKYEKLRDSGDPELVMRHLARYADPSRRKRYTK